MEITRECKLGCLGTYVSSCFFLSFALPFLDLFSGKIKYDDTPGIFILINYFNCLAWYLYGDLIESSPIKVNYLACLIMSGILLAIYLFYESKQYLSDAVLNFLIIAVSTWIVRRIAELMGDNDDRVFSMCIISNILVFLAPIQIVLRVFKENNYNLIPIYSAAISLVGCFVWLLYAFNTKDFRILILPNFIGLITSILQILTYRKFRESAPDYLSRQNESQINVDDSKNKIEVTSIQSSEIDSNENERIKERPVTIKKSSK